MTVRLFFTALVALLATFFCGGGIAQSPYVTTYDFWAGSSSPIRRQYEIVFIQQLLDKTTDRFGPYELRVFGSDGANYDAAERVQSGKFDIAVDVDWGYKVLQDKDIFRLPYNIWGEYLGYRQFIVRKDKLALFEGINTIDDMKEIRVGQVVNWKDNQFYIDNGIPLITAQSFSSLFTMLEFGRFDAVPLGVNEVESTLKDNNAKGLFTIVPHLVVRYPISAHFLVSGDDAVLVERLTLAFERVRSNGDDKALLQSFMNGKLEELAAPEMKFIDLKLSGSIALPNTP